MDLAVTLVKSVMRAFYTTRDILVIDALILHETLRDVDLAYLMATNPKDLHKICGKLREDRFLSVHVRPELKEGNPRPTNRTWYYINYRQTIDAIKWRVYNIDKEVQGNTIPANEKKEYFCTHCKAEWTLMEALDNAGPDGFLCHRCAHTLTFEADRNSGGHEQSTRLNDQFKFIGELLPQIDAKQIPECDFDRAFAKHRPIVRDETHQLAPTFAVDADGNRPMAVKGLTNTGPQSIAVNFSTSAGPSEAEREAERARKEKIAKQNALPSWMSNSTVTGDSFSGDAAAGAATTKKEADDKSAASKPLIDSSASAQIDDIFEKLKAEQAAERAREAAEEEDDDEFSEEEDEDDEDLGLEDVPATGNTSSLGTPAIKQEGSGTVSREAESSDERQAKRVKVEPQVKKEEDSDEDEDEELEFEDV